MPFCVPVEFSQTVMPAQQHIVQKQPIACLLLLRVLPLLLTSLRPTPAFAQATPSPHTFLLYPSPALIRAFLCASSVLTASSGPRAAERAVPVMVRATATNLGRAPSTTSTARDSLPPVARFLHVSMSNRPCHTHCYRKRYAACEVDAASNGSIYETLRYDVSLCKLASYAHVSNHYHHYHGIKT